MEDKTKGIDFNYFLNNKTRFDPNTGDVVFSDDYTQHTNIGEPPKIIIDNNVHTQPLNNTNNGKSYTNDQSSTSLAIEIEYTEKIDFNPDTCTLFTYKGRKVKDFANFLIKNKIRIIFDKAFNKEDEFLFGVQIFPKQVINYNYFINNNQFKIFYFSVPVSKCTSKDVIECFKYYSKQECIFYDIKGVNKANMLSNYISFVDENPIPIYCNYFCGWQHQNQNYFFNRNTYCYETTYSNKILNRNMEVNEKMSAYEAIDKSLQMLNISEELSESLPLFLWGHSSVLFSLFNDLNFPINYILALTGDVSIHKNEILKHFFLLYNRSKNNITASFSTPTEILVDKMFLCKDECLVLAAYEPSIDKKENTRKQAFIEKIIGFYHHGNPEVRLVDKKSKSTEAFYCRGTLATCFDNFPDVNSLSGSFAIELKKENFNGNLMRELLKTPLTYSTHLSHFISYVEKNYKNSVSKLERDINEAISQYSKHILSHGDVNIFAILYSTMCTLIQYMTDIEYITVQESHSLKDEYTHSILDAINQSKGNLASKDTGVMCLKALAKMIETGQIEPLQRIGSSGDINESNERVYEDSFVYVDKAYYYISKEYLYKIVQNFYSISSISFKASEFEMVQSLKKLNVIKTDTDSCCIKTTISSNQNKRVRLLNINIEKMKLILKENSIIHLTIQDDNPDEPE